MMLFINKNRLLLIYNTLNDKLGHFYHQKNQKNVPLINNDRSSWEKTLSNILHNLLPYFKNEDSLILPPFRKISVSGKKSDGLEMFARSFLGFAILMSNIDNKTIDEDTKGKIQALQKKYIHGLSIGIDSESKYFWNKIKSEQKNCEAGIIALALLILNRNETINISHLDSKLIKFFQHNIQKDYKKNNWLWFKLWQILFLYDKKNIDKQIIKKEIAQIENLYDSNETWYKDGKNAKHIDYYNAWAFQFYNQCFIYLFQKDFTNQAKNLQNRFGQFWSEYQNFFDAEGRQLIYGRSLLYKFASVSPIALGLANTEKNIIAQAKNLIINNINYFISNKSFDNHGLLTVGYHTKNIKTSEYYSGGGSPYWALKGFSALLLPKKHYFWQYEAKKHDIKPRTIIKDVDSIITNKNNIIIFLNGSSLHNKYPLKYNKFAYSNVCSFILDNKFPVDNDLLLYTSKNKIYSRYKNITSQLINNEILIDWQDKNKKFYVKTKIRIIHNGYNIKHQISSQIKNFHFAYGGFAISSNRNNFSVKMNGAKYCIKNKYESSIKINNTNSIKNIKYYTKINKNLDLLNKFSATPVISGQVKEKKYILDLSITIR